MTLTRTPPSTLAETLPITSSAVMKLAVSAVREVWTDRVVVLMELPCGRGSTL